MEIKNVRVYGLDDSIVASGYPMLKENYSIERASKLGGCRTGTGHDCFLKGIIVQADVTASQVWWLQFGRYHFSDIISSQSKMHKVTEMSLVEQCNDYVFSDFIAKLNKYIHWYNNYEQYEKITGYPFSKEELWNLIIYNIPMGLELTARITTNYLQLKSQYLQRKNHKLKEWKHYCRWVEGLPMFLDLTGRNKNE